MAKQPEANGEEQLAKAARDAETAKRRATMALRCAREALRLSLSTPRIGEMLREIDKELVKDEKP